VLGFLCGGETWTRVGPPIPSSPVNSMAKGPTKPGAAPAPKTTGMAPVAKTTGVAAGAAPKAGQKTAAGQTDQVGDICLLPDIARAH